METKETISLREARHWTCMIEGHFHKTRRVAENCIKKQSASKAIRRIWTNEMRADLCSDLLSGATLKSLGIKYGVTRQHIRQVYQKSMRIMCRSAMNEGDKEKWDSFSLEKVRKDSEIWNRRIAKLREEAEGPRH